MYWDKDLEACPEDSIESVPPMNNRCSSHRKNYPIPVIEDADNTNPDPPEGKKFVDADADLTELDENSPDTYVILRDDPSP